MADVQIEPLIGGSWLPATPDVIVADAPAYAVNAVTHAVNLYRICGGQPGAMRTRAEKIVTAVGVSLRWA